jgi:hypothetical protein
MGDHEVASSGKHWPKDLVVFPWDSKKKVHKAATYEEVQEAIKKVFGK